VKDLVGHPVTVPGPELGRPLHVGEQDRDRVAAALRGSRMVTLRGRGLIWSVPACRGARANFKVDGEGPS
jgi:hypothetical protein